MTLNLRKLMPLWRMTVLLIFILGLSYAASLMPERLTLFVRIFNGFSILTFLIWFAVQVFEHRDDLQAHRAEIIALLSKRDQEVERLEQIAAALAVDTARIAKELAQETRIAAEIASEKISGLSVQIAEGNAEAKRTYVEANSVNAKMDVTNTNIEHLNERLVEQGKESHGKLDFIEEVTKDSHEILKVGQVVELKTQADKAVAATEEQTAKIDTLSEQILEQAIKSDEKLDTIQTTTEDSHEILKEKLVDIKKRK